MEASGETVTPEPERWRVEEWCDRYLGGRPSDPVLQLIKNAEGQRLEVRNFLERAFRLMALAKFDPRDLSPGVARFFVVFAPSILPDVWGGMVPPITMPGRHKKIDAYLRSNPWANFDPGTVLLDLGCGFPPDLNGCSRRISGMANRRRGSRLRPIPPLRRTRKLCLVRRQWKAPLFSSYPPSRVYSAVLRSECHDSAFLGSLRATSPRPFRG